jgi:UDP-N-acetylmuramoyl-tripeptide--D-alanyl-D-alanine ligase
MSGLSVDEIVSATNGELLGGARDIEFPAISIDSRKIQPGELFWAIRGEHFNGNDFIPEVLKKGAAGLVTDNELTVSIGSESVPLIKVGSSLDALQKLASYNRDKHPVPLVAITGSNGKTTTKEMVASILACKYEVLKNEGNLNNLIGVPLTLLRLHTDHEAAVIEMGMNKAGEIRALAHMARPNLGIITNIGEAHLEGLGSIENIKRAKGELVEALNDEDQVVLNADDASVMELQAYAKGKVTTFGIKNDAHIMAGEVEIEWGKGTLFILYAGGRSIPVLLPIYGVHQLYNALAASAAAYSLGFSLQEIREGLEAYNGYSGRMEIIHLQGVAIINDSYNANPPSVRYAIETMKKLAEGRTIAVLGDMLELGAYEEKIHSHMGCFAHEQGLDCIVTVGKRARKIASGAIESGMEANKVRSFDSTGDATNYLKGLISEGDWILVKGSRGMKMDTIASQLIDDLKMKERS